MLTAFRMILSFVCELCFIVKILIIRGFELDPKAVEDFPSFFIDGQKLNNPLKQGMEAH